MAKGKKRTPTSKLHGAALARRLEAEGRLGKVAGRGKSVASKIGKDYDELVKHMVEDKVIPEAGEALVRVTPMLGDMAEALPFEKKIRRSYAAHFSSKDVSKQLTKLQKEQSELAKKKFIAERARSVLHAKLENYFGKKYADAAMADEDRLAKERAAKQTVTPSSAEGGR
jgi:hypothetical protein